jgi:hypothetical protein
MTKHPEYHLVNRLGVFDSRAAVFTAAMGLAGRAGSPLHLASLKPWGAVPVAMFTNRRPTLSENTKSAAKGSL